MRKCGFLYHINIKLYRNVQKKQGYERWTFTSLSEFGFLKRPF